MVEAAAPVNKDVARLAPAALETDIDCGAHLLHYERRSIRSLSWKGIVKDFHVHFHKAGVCLKVLGDVRWNDDPNA